MCCSTSPYISANGSNGDDVKCGVYLGPMPGWLTASARFAFFPGNQVFSTAQMYARCRPFRKHMPFRAWSYQQEGHTISFSHSSRHVVWLMAASRWMHLNSLSGQKCQDPPEQNVAARASGQVYWSSPITATSHRSPNSQISSEY